MEDMSWERYRRTLPITWRIISVMGVEEVIDVIENESLS